MKLYRVTVRYKKDNSIKFHRVYAKASSVHSCVGYWRSRYTRPTYETVYDVTVETAFVNNWTPLDPNLEKIEKAIEEMPILDAVGYELLFNRLAANLASKTVTTAGA